MTGSSSWTHERGELCQADASTKEKASTTSLLANILKKNPIPLLGVAIRVAIPFLTVKGDRTDQKGPGN